MAKGDRFDRIVDEVTASAGLVILVGMVAFTLWALYVLLFT